MSFEAVSKQVNLELIKSIACLSEEEQAFKDKRDRELRDVITGKDQRFLLVIGPCSADKPGNGGDVRPPGDRRQTMERSCVPL